MVYQVFQTLAFTSHALKSLKKRFQRTSSCSVRPYMCVPNRPAHASTILTVAASSAILGPLLDNYYSQLHVLSYKNPIKLHLLFGRIPINVTTAPFTPPLFILAGCIIAIGVLWINDEYVPKAEEVSVPRALASIASFSAIYYLSACLPCTALAVATGPILVFFSALQWYVLDGYAGGLIMGLLTAIAGPAIEMALINLGHLYSYSQPEFGGIPLFVIPVYFAGGSAVGNLALAVAARNSQR